MKVDRRYNTIALYFSGETILKYRVINLWSTNLNCWVIFQKSEAQAYYNAEFDWTMYVFTTKSAYDGVILPEEENPQISIVK